MLLIFALLSASDADREGASLSPTIEHFEDLHLTDEAMAALEKQKLTMATDFVHKRLMREAGRNWDRFYKRNGTRFFKVSCKFGVYRRFGRCLGYLRTFKESINQIS